MRSESAPDENVMLHECEEFFDVGSDGSSAYGKQMLMQLAACTRRRSHGQISDAIHSTGRFKIPCVV